MICMMLAPIDVCDAHFTIPKVQDVSVYDPFRLTINIMQITVQTASKAYILVSKPFQLRLHRCLAVLAHPAVPNASLAERNGASL
jgi:hypothetical protein